MQKWWLERMIASPAPLQEKMTLFWHGHFTSSPEKGTTAQELLAQNQLFREYALGNIQNLTLHVAQDPAMLRYLDNNVNVAAHPNENFARELMELFTLGIGNYTEADIRESARAFTGWTFRRDPDGTGTFYDNARQHDDGSKTFLGRTGNFSGTDIIAIIFTQPAAAKFFANRLISFFVYNDPEPQLVDAVAALLVRNRFEVAPVLATLLRSNVFYSNRAYRALVKSPVEFVVGTHQMFNVPTVELTELGALRTMGQVLFYPPNVKGWDGGKAWINSQTVLTRENFANAVAQNPMMLQDAGWITSTMQSMDPKAISTTLTQGLLQGDVSAAAMPAPWAASPARMSTNASAAPPISRWPCRPTSCVNSRDHHVRKASHHATQKLFARRDLGALGRRIVRQRVRASVRAIAGTGTSRRRRPRARRDQLPGRQRRPQHRRPVRPAGLLSDAALARDPARRRTAHRRYGRSQPGARAVQEDVRQRRGRDRARRRLSGPGSLALPLDGDLADGCAADV
jgi:hypothetical protein